MRPNGLSDHALVRCNDEGGVLEEKEEPHRLQRSDRGLGEAAIEIVDQYYQGDVQFGERRLEIVPECLNRLAGRFRLCRLDVGLLLRLLFVEELLALLHTVNGQLLHLFEVVARHVAVEQAAHGGHPACHPRCDLPLGHVVEQCGAGDAQKAQLLHTTKQACRPFSSGGGQRVLLLNRLFDDGCCDRLHERGAGVVIALI